MDFLTVSAATAEEWHANTGGLSVLSQKKHEGPKMKIEARLESIGDRLRPVLFFPDDVERDKTIGCYSPRDGHGTAARAYMRQCRKPQSPEEYAAVFKALGDYFTAAASYAAKR